MKNKFLVGVITVFVTLVLCIVSLNFLNPSKETFYFDRVFSKDTILTLDKDFKKMNNDEYVKYVYSDNLIVEHDTKIIDENQKEYSFYLNDINFKNRVAKKIILPRNSNVLLCNLEEIYYTNNFILYKNDFATKKSFQISDSRIKVFSLKTLPNSKSKLLCFGEYKQKDSFVTGFFVVDIATNNIKIVKNLENNQETTMPKNGLIYAGCFNFNYEKTILVYTCNKYSKIYFFNSKGMFIKELITADNVPLPEIFTNKKGDSFYSRGGTWTTNMGMFIKNDKIFVFSYRAKEEFKLLIDEYSYLNLRYVKSYKLNYLNQNVKSIRNVFIDKDKIVIGFEFNYASFIFSRYI